MVDVVGTALVRVKALTDKLAKDIEKDVKKAMKDANLEKASKDKGEEVGEDFGESLADSTEKTLKKRSKDMVPGDEINDEFSDLIKGVQKQFQQLDFDGAFTGVRENFEQLSFEDIDVDVDVDSAAAEAALARVRLESTAVSKDIDIDVDVDSIAAEAALARVRLASKRLADDIGSNRGLSKTLDGLRGRLNSLGQTSLPHIGRLTTAIGLIGGAIVAALPYIQDVGSAILAYATGLVAQIGFLVTALGGLGAAAGAAIGAAATAALPIVLAFKAETDVLVEFKDSMAAAGEEFLRIGVATQQTLLPALDEAVFILGDLVPMFSEFGLFVGRSVGDFARLAANVLTGNVAQGRFQDILQSSLRILDVLLPTLINVGDILSGIFVAALPAAERLVVVVGDLVARWTDMVNQGLRTGELTEQFDLWLDRALLLGGALGNVAGALFDILEVGATSADGVFRRFDEWAQRFRDFTESEAGQNRLALIFDNALSVMREINAIVADIFDGIFGRLGEVGGVDSMVAALQRFRDVIPEIQEFWADALVVIERVVRLFASSVWEKITQAWEQMAEPLGRLATQFSELLQVIAESGAFDVFLDLMEILANVLSTLLAIPGFGTFIAYFIAFNAALKVTSIILSPLLGAFRGLVGILFGLGGAAGGLRSLAAGFTAVNAAGGTTSLVQGLRFGASEAGGFAGAIGGAAAALSGPMIVGLGLAGSALAIGGLAFFNHQQRAQRWAQEIRQATESLGLLNDGLNITAEGVTKYITEFSRFESRDQLDDLERLRFTVSSLGDEVARGSLTYEEFTNRTLSTGETYVVINDRIKDTTSNLQGLQEQYGLTDDEVRRLAQGEEIYADGTKLVLEGNTSLLASFVELNKVIGAAAKENIDEFVTNAQNVRLLGANFLSDLKQDIDVASDDSAARLQADAQDALAAAAIKSSAAIKGLSDATRDQIREQSLMADGTVDVVKENQLLTDAITKQNAELRANLELFAGPKFRSYYPEAKAAVNDFLTVFENINVPAFDDLGVDEMVAQFPEAVAATDALFTALRGLPEEEFSAAAAALGADAGALKEAMNAAQQAIIDLQNTAVETLPSIGELLDEATETREDGSQFFNEKEFLQAAQDRVRQTIEFGANIEDITTRFGVEAGILAAQQGPEAAANLSKIVGADADALKTTLANMESAETFLREQIANNLGPGIGAQFLDTAAIWGESLPVGIASGITSEAAQEALRDAGVDTINMLAQGFQGEFVLEDGVLSFKHTGVFRRFNPTKRPQSLNQKLLAGGGLVDLDGVNGMFSRVGTDIVPAMLTPGEFVNTAATVDRLGVPFFEALNKGATPAVPVGGGGISANGWTIVAPTPEESARQMISRFRTMSFLLGGG